MQHGFMKKFFGQFESLSKSLSNSLLSKVSILSSLTQRGFTLRGGGFIGISEASTSEASASSSESIQISPANSWSSTITPGMSSQMPVQSRVAQVENLSESTKTHGEKQCRELHENLSTP